MRNRTSKQPLQEKMPALHIFLLFTIFILFAVIVFESVVAVVDVYYVMEIENYWDTVLHQWYLFLLYSVFSIRDFFIAVLFSYLYYYRGMKEREKDTVRLSPSYQYKMIKTINPYQFEMIADKNGEYVLDIHQNTANLKRPLTSVDAMDGDFAPMKS